MRIILLGLPGSGKEQLARSLADHYKIPVLTLESTLTEIAAEKTELGRLVKEAAFAGKFSDELIMAALRIRLARKDAKDGFIMEDFPRSTGQAETLDILLKGLRRPLNAVVKIDIEPDDLMEHLVGQITCQNCGAKYNIYNNPPIVEGMCNECGEKIRSRPDDYEENIANRLRNCEMIMMPLERLYGLQKKMVPVPGNQTDKKIFKNAVKLLDALPPIEIPEGDDEATLPMDESLLKALMAPKSDEDRPRRRGRPPRKRLQQEMAEITAAEEAKEKAAKEKAAASEKGEEKAKKPAAKSKVESKPAKESKVAKKKAAAKPAKTTKPVKKAESGTAKKAKTVKTAKATAKKAEAKKTTKKVPAKKAVSKKAVTEKKAVTKKKAAVKKKSAVTKKVAAKKKVVKKAAVKKKVVSKKVVTKKAASKPQVKKKTAAKKAVTKKKVSKKPVSKKAVVKKAVAKKKLSKKTPIKKASKKAVSKKVVKKKATVKKKPVKTAKKKVSRRR